MDTDIVKWVFSSDGGIWASVIGVVISVIGFTLTLFNVIRSKSAANRAEIAANLALEGVRYFDSVEQLSKAITIIEEIRRLNRAKEWKVILDRHTSFRSILTGIKSANINFNEDQKARFQAAITHSASISHKIELALEKGEEPRAWLK